ncbi:RNA polymerase II mediator complex subunit [Podila minutissima]|uniref:Mediator of RNA polymerase II transcription subunit 12 n=1 Tax=Podila minutissima TaxID=64525 RepID=A0A9P5SUN1_9FUNG|nr:RNA polymerase II mediator complex subunit [Podila minutissima]
MSKYPGGHHTANHSRGFPQINNNHGPGYPPGSGGPIQGGPGISGPMNMMNAGVGSGRMNYSSTVRNNAPPMGYSGGGNLNGPGYPGYATTNMTNPGGYVPHPSQHTTPTHSPFSSSPSSSGYPNKSHSSSPLRRYILLPPPKQRKLHKTSDLGYPGVFPQKPNQDEDQMTPHNVKTGYIDKGIIQNETVSAQGILSDGLQDPKKLQELGAFMVEVLKKRQESSRITGPSTFRPPSRATLTEQKKEQWMSDLSGTISLRKLSKSVPHGFKSEKLLEVLAQRQVPMLRATWYIKIVALSEMQAQRSRPSTQHKYSADWTNTVNSFLKKQLLEINPHSTARPTSTLNPASAAQNVKPWASEEAKEKWESKWQYSMMLTKWQYNEGLLDHRNFLRTTVETLSTLGFEQVALLLNLISMFLSEYARSRLLMRLLIEGLLNTLQSSIFLSTPDMFLIPKVWVTHSNLLHQLMLKDIQSTSHRPAVFPNVGSVLESHYKMIQARVKVFTDLTSSSTATNSDDNRSLYGNVDILDKVDASSDLTQVAHQYFEESGEGSTSALETPPKSAGVSPAAVTPSTSIILPPTSDTTPLNSPHSLDEIWKFKVNTLCEWAITNSRYGLHRIYLVGTLLSVWKESPILSASHISADEKGSRLQSALLEFLDRYMGGSTLSHHLSHSHTQGHHHHQLSHNPDQGIEETHDAIARLFGNLIHSRLFSYQQYLQRLIARGDLQPSKRGEESTLRHLKYLQSFPLHNPQPHQLNQRRVVLFGVNGEDEYDRESFETITTQIRAKLPYMFSPEAGNMTTPIKDTAQDAQELGMTLPVQLSELILSASRFCQLRVTSQWLLSAVKSYVVKHIQIGEDNWRVMTSPGSSLLNGRQLATVVCVMEIANDFHSLYDMCIWLLDHTHDKVLLTYIVNLAKKHHLVWFSMGVSTKFAQEILTKHYQLQGKNIVIKALPRFLARDARQVPEDIRLQMQADLAGSKSGTTPGTSMPAQIQELQHLVRDTSSTAASNIASSLYVKYGGLAHFQLQLFNGCIDSLQKMDSEHRSHTSTLTTSNGQQEVVRASRLYAELLADLAERAGNGNLDNVIVSWLGLHDIEWMIKTLGKDLSGTCPGSVIADSPQLCHPIWFLSFMAQMVIQGFCTIEVLVQGMCGDVLSKISSSIQPSSLAASHHHPHHHHPPQHHGHSDESQATIPDEATLRLVMTMVLLLRLLLIEESSSCTKANGYGGSGLHHSHHQFGDPKIGFQLTLAEIHALQTQRFSRLQTPERMQTQFQICRDLIWIESALPLNHPVLHEIQEYRKDWALSADWLREKCLANVDGAYKMFLQTKETQQQQMEGPDINMDNSGNNLDQEINSKKHTEVVDRKMMETFQMLVAENHESLMLMDTMGDSSLAPSMIHQRTFRGIFSRVDRWIFDRCKVEFWLLLDNVMMLVGSTIGRGDKDGKSTGDSTGGLGAVVGGSSHESTSGTSSRASSDTLMMMEGVTMASTQSDSLTLTDGSVDTPELHSDADCLQALIRIFFEEFVLTEKADKELLGRMLIGMRSDVVEEFIRYGYGLLAGSAIAPFPQNVMLVQRPVSSAVYLKIASNFHYVMEILLRETTPLSLVVEESGTGNPLSVGTPSASTPSASASASQNSGPAAATSSAISSLQDLDPAQLESRISFAKSLLWQLKKFEDRTRVFDVMHAIGVSYEDAYKVVQENEINGANMEDLLLNASIQHQQKQQQQHQQMQNHQQQSMSSDTPSTLSSSSSPAIHLIDLRASLCLRLRLLVPLLPVVLHQPETAACDLGTLVVRLTNLLVSSLVHGHGSEERLFEFCLDMASCLMDEVLLLSGGQDLQVNRERRNEVLHQLRTGLPQMTTTIPTVFSSRIFRILPFQQHNVYFTSLSIAGDNLSKQGSSAAANTPRELQPRPWDWLEDCVGDVDGSQHTVQQLPTPNLGLGLGVMDAGGASNGLDGPGSVPGAAAASSPFSGTSAGTSENLNDTSISLTFFGAKQIQKAEGTTYQTQFKLGHGGGDDEQELILVDQQHRPSHYNHSQQLLLQQQQLLRQQQQQEFETAAIAAAGRAMDTPGSMFDSGSSNNMMDMDVNLSVNSSVGGPPSSQTRPSSSLSAPTLQAQQEPDPELEEGQILGDDDLDMAWANNGQVVQNSVVAPNSTSSSTSSVSVPLMQQQQQQQLQGLANQIEDGELIEPMILSGSLSGQNSIKSDVDFGSLPTTSAATVAPVVTSAGQLLGISTPTTLTTSIAVPSPTMIPTAAVIVPTASAASKKRASVTGVKAARGAAAPKAARGGAKGSRGGKAGTKTVAVASSAPTSSAATVSLPTTVMEVASISVPPTTLPTSAPITSLPVSVPPVQQPQPHPQQPPQPQPQQQQQPFQVQPPMMHMQMPPGNMTLQQFHQQQQRFQQQFRPQGTMQPNLMSIALPGQPQPPMMSGNGANGTLTPNQIMAIMRQGQNPVSGAGGVGGIIGGMGGIGGIGPGGNHMVAAFSGGGGVIQSTMIGGIHVPMINNGQPQFQNQPQQQNNFMDPSMFLNNSNSNNNSTSHLQQQHHQQQQQFQQQQGQQGQDGGNNMW